MNLSEKMNLLWKYLLLVVLAWGVYAITNKGRHSYPDHGKMEGLHEMRMMGGHGEMMWFGNGDMMTVQIEKKIVDGDTTIIAIVNGEEVEVEEISEVDGVKVIITKDGKTIKMGAADKRHKQKRIKKKMDKD